MHQKQAEHWVVVKVVDTVINGEEILTLTEGQSIYIP
jgi:mannose-1-phosphate guanylyltransferase/mannose-6-phosphate isomerase